MILLLHCECEGNLDMCLKIMSSLGDRSVVPMLYGIVDVVYHIRLCVFVI